jgi:hypothetical protein
MSGTTIELVDRVRAGAPAAIVLAAIALIAACSSPTRTASPAPLPSPSPVETFVAPSLDIEQPGLTPSAGQTDTGWGLIWNELPRGFPEPKGAEPADDVTEPVSAAWTITADSASDPKTIAQRFTDAFSAAGYGGGRDGPLEDGSYTAWGSNGYGCDMLVTALRRGEDSLVTVLYGAGCPFSWPET